MNLTAATASLVINDITFEDQDLYAMAILVSNITRATLFRGFSRQ